MKRALIGLAVLAMISCFVISCSKMPQRADNTIQISVMKSGKILANGTATTVAELGPVLDALKKSGGTVWLYKEKALDEVLPAASEVTLLITEKGLPIVTATKPDFSTYIGEDGQPVSRGK